MQQDIKMILMWPIKINKKSTCNVYKFPVVFSQFCFFSSPGQSPGRAVVLTPVLVLASAAAAGRR